MTLTSTTVKLTYNGDGVQESFPVTFNFWDLDDLRVILRDENVTPATETVMTRGATYNVTGGNGSTGTVTIITPPSSNIPISGEKLIIKSDVPSTQTTSLPLGGAIPSASVEQRLDKNVRLIQQAEEVLSRAPLLEETTLLTNPSFPAPGANQFIKWNAAGTALETSSSSNADAVLETEYVANSIRYKQNDGVTMANVVLAASEIPGRKQTGEITNMTGAEFMTETTALDEVIPLILALG